MTEVRSSSSIDKVSNGNDLDKYVKGLLDAPTDTGEFAGKTETEQGIAIMDRFVGALARTGDIVDSNGQTHTVETTLQLMSRLQKMEDLKGITRTGGLRGAAIRLAQDPRTIQLFSSAYGGAVEKDQSGNMLLRNEDQIAGYIKSANNRVPRVVPGVHMSGADWVGIVEERIDMVLNPDRNGQWIFDSSRGLIESDNDYLRKEGMKWRMAEASAKQVGVDPALLGRSVEAIASKRRQDKMALAQRALSQTVTTKQ